MKTTFLLLHFFKDSTTQKPQKTDHYSINSFQNVEIVEIKNTDLMCWRSPVRLTGVTLVRSFIFIRKNATMKRRVNEKNNNTTHTNTIVRL